MKKAKTTRQILTALLSGRHPQAAKFAGKHVLVVKREIIPLKRGKAGLADIKRLEKKYKETPTIVFIPRPDISYILILCPR
ncbi:MAG: hypothetical protein ACOZBZ_02450 [Patescibacteria group bacterium]